jgi:heat shock protein HtpX
VLLDRAREHDVRRPPCALRENADPVCQNACMAVTKTAFGRDPGLQARMLLTLFLLGALYVPFAVALVAGAGTSGTTALLICGGLAAFQLFTSDKLALHAMGAREVTPHEAPELHAMIERLCIQADLPKPKVAVAHTDMPNAFALGRSQKSATVCATTGIMNLLSPGELEGVMAHELAHVKHRDVAIMTLASFFASVAATIAQFGFLFGGSSDDDDSPGIFFVIIVSLVVYAVSFFLMMALSRYREFVADRGAALVTGRPSALASALRRISSGIDRLPQQDLRAAGELSAFFIAPPTKASIAGLFATHPPMEQRIAKLMDYERELQTGTLAAA